MARPLRIEYPGAVYHVTTRGNARQEIFLDDSDRAAFLGALAHAIHRMGWLCYAYCLMPNHYHLVVETPEGNLSRGMRQVNGIYTQAFNRRHERVGHVFQGRYKAILVDRDEYLKVVCRYVVLNPVWAGLAQKPEEWRWSSYAATIGIVSRPDWLSTDGLLGQFGQERSRTGRVYAAFVAEGLKGGGDGLWAQISRQIYLGKEDFIRKAQERLRGGGDISEIPKVQRRSMPKTLADYHKEAGDRRRAMAMAQGVGKQ